MIRRRSVPLLMFLGILVVAALVYYFGFAGTSGNKGFVSYDIRINEVMTSNKGAVAAPNGSYPDWVEIANTTDKQINISGYGLTDDKLGAAKFAFPAGTVIEPYGYIVVYCSGNSADGPMFADFKLSAADDLVLLDPSGRPVDSLALKEVPAGSTLGRDATTGDWTVQSEISPGYPNTPDGAAKYRESIVTRVDMGVVINEVMPSNGSTIVDKNGNYSDWVELYNNTDQEIDLSGFGLSDDLSRPMRWNFPQGTKIPPQGYLVVFLSGESSDSFEEELHAPFSLRAYGEDIVLTSAQGLIVDSYTYQQAETDVSFARNPDGTGDFKATSEPTPGHPNTSSGYQEFLSGLSAATGPLVITELLASNDSYAKAPDGQYYSWVEIYNSGNETISLAGHALTDSAKNPAKWKFPDDAAIAPGQYLVVLTSGNDVKDTKKKYLETNFKISSDTASVLLYDESANLLDKLTSAVNRFNVAVGKDADGNRMYYETPTPGERNGSGKKGIASTPVILTTPGIYDNSITVEISTAADEQIYYTTDASIPTSSSNRYTGPITVDKNTVIRAISYKEGYLVGSSASATYLFKNDGVNHALPVACLVMDPDDLWNSKTGIYATGESFDPDLPTAADILTSALYYQSKFGNKDFYERDANFSIFDDSGKQVFNQNIGARIAGSFGRMRAQKGFNLIARDEYGANRMAYKFFDNRDFTEYKALVLRAGGQDQSNGKIRDELATGLLDGSDVKFLYQAYKPYVLYLNGEYWGVYFLKEKRNRFFVAQHEGTEDNTNLDIGYASTRVSYGSNEDWLSIMNYVKNNDLSFSATSPPSPPHTASSLFMDYMIAEIYTGNTDTANIQYYKYRDGGKWKWIYYDFCWGFQSPDHQTLTFRRSPAPAGSDLFNALLKNSKWRDKFIRRFAELLKTIYAPERVLALIDELYQAVEPEIAREREKFNQATFRGEKQPSLNVSSYQGFLTHIERLKKFANERPDSLKRQLKAEFALSDAYMQEVFG